MGQLNDVIHQPVRLRIMATLNTLPPDEYIDFVRLRAIVGATEGNLGAHLSTLEKSEYIAVIKDHVGKKPRTQMRMTPAGRLAFEQHLIELKALLSGSI